MSWRTKREIEIMSEYIEYLESQAEELDQIIQKQRQQIADLNLQIERLTLMIAEDISEGLIMEALMKKREGMN